MTKRLRKYLKDLLILSILGSICGVFVLYLLLQSKHPEDWQIYALPIKILGVISAYILTTFIAPGGNSNYYFAQVHLPNEDEKLLNRLIAKYKNNIVIALPGIIYLCSDIIFGYTRYNANSISFDTLGGTLIMSFFFGLAMMTGAKYGSALWNMKKILEKDPSGEILISSVENDSVLAKLDSPKPIIDLPKILKKIFK